MHAAASRHRSESLRNVWEYGNALNTLVAASAPNNPFGQDIVVSVPMVGGDGAFISTLDIGQLSAGANFALWGGWKLGADATAGQSKLKLSGPESRDLADSVYTGAMDVLRDTTAHPFDVSEFWQDWKTSPFRTATREMTLLLGGPLAPLPAGPLTLTASVQRREERYTGGEEWRNDGPGTPFNQIITRGKQSLFVTSAYSELRAPLIPRELARAGLHGLELQLAVRFDSYTTDVALAHAESEDRGEDDYARADFSSWNGVAGLRYQPTPGMTFRASYSTGFLPPRVSDLVPPRERRFGAGAFIDERRGGEPTADVLILAGGNPLLRPERSASTSVGFLLKPGNVPNFRLSIDGVRIVKTDNIYVVGELAFDNLLRYEEMFPERVTREAVAAGDAYGIGRIRTIDATNINAARMEVVSVDVDLRYAKDVPHLGLLEVASMGTWVADFKMQPTPLAPLREYVGTTAERPLEFRATLGLSVTKGRWGYGWDVRYFGPYKVSDEPQIVSNQGTLKVSHQVFHDTYVSWQTEGLEGLPKAVELRLGVRNVFDVRPRFDAGAAGNSYYSRVGDPRLAAYYLAVTAGF